MHQTGYLTQGACTPTSSPQPGEFTGITDAECRLIGGCYYEQAAGPWCSVPLHGYYVDVDEHSYCYCGPHYNQMSRAAPAALAAQAAALAL